jgi:hypothetical protein
MVTKVYRHKMAGCVESECAMRYEIHIGRETLGKLTLVHGNRSYCLSRKR